MNNKGEFVMNIKKRMLSAAAAVCCLFCLCSCGRNGTLLFGTGNIGGNYYSYGSAYAQLLGRDNEKIKINIKDTAGSAANLRLIQQGFLDIAVSQSDTLIDAWNGKGNFSGMQCSGIRAVAGLYTEECQIIVRNDSDIQTVADLYEKKVSVGEKESGVKKNAEEILMVNGLNYNMIDESYLSFSDSAEALENRSIDAFFCTAGAPTTAVTELAKETDIRILSLDDRTVERMIKEYPGYTACIIPAGTYSGQTDDIQTVGVKAVLVASAGVSTETGRQLAETLFSHSSELRYATSASGLDRDFAVSDIPVPFHSGAAAWYAEHGITVPTDENGKTGSYPNAAQD